MVRDQQMEQDQSDPLQMPQALPLCACGGHTTGSLLLKWFMCARSPVTQLPSGPSGLMALGSVGSEGYTSHEAGKLWKKRPEVEHSTAATPT